MHGADKICPLSPEDHHLKRETVDLYHRKINQIGCFARLCYSDRIEVGNFRENAMIALREIHKVENGRVTIHLPADFPAEQVEVIVLPARTVNGMAVYPPGEDPAEMAASIQSFLDMDTSHFTSEQHKAYERTCATLRKGRKPDEPRILGLFSGLINVADDFDDPLPGDLLSLFYAGPIDPALE